MRQETVSVVVPVFGESENLRAVVRALRTTLAAVPDIQYEVIFVDDGSRDASWSVIEELHAGDASIKGIRFTRKFGQQAALTAGYHHASGDAVITMDGDLEHSAELLPHMIAKWRAGYDVVSMVRLRAREEGRFKARLSRRFYKLMRTVSDAPMRSGATDFRLLDRRVVKQVNSLKERDRFVRGLIYWTGFRETQIHYRPAPHGGYSLRKTIASAMHSMTSYSSAPLRLGFHAGLLVLFACLVLMGYAVYNRIYEARDLTEWASTFLTMLFLGGVQLLMIGVVGVYVGRIFDEIKKRPVYVASAEVGIARRAARPTEKRQAAAAGSVAR